MIMVFLIFKFYCKMPFLIFLLTNEKSHGENTLEKKMTPLFE